MTIQSEGVEKAKLELRSPLAEPKHEPNASAESLLELGTISPGDDTPGHEVAVVVRTAQSQK